MDIEFKITNKKIPINDKLKEKLLKNSNTYLLYIDHKLYGYIFEIKGKYSNNYYFFKKINDNHFKFIKNIISIDLKSLKEKIKSLLETSTTANVGFFNTPFWIANEKDEEEKEYYLKKMGYKLIKKNKKK